MKKTKVVSIIIFLVVAGAVIYFAYGVFKNRYQNLKKEPREHRKYEEPKDGETGSTENRLAEEENFSSASDIEFEKEEKPVIENTDCQNDCRKYKGNEFQYRYCQEVCGDRPAIPKDSEEQCKTLSGLAENSCWRDLAISKKDPDICENITDLQLKKACRNRVIEELLD